MADEAPGIVVLHTRIEKRELARLVRLYFEDMVKVVVDVERGLTTSLRRAIRSSLRTESEFEHTLVKTDGGGVRFGLAPKHKRPAGKQLQFGRVRE